MKRKFYKIPFKSYLFEKNEHPEEEVRQWVLFELLSSYGININNIEVETPVKIGSKKFRADIVVKKDHIPYIVIECKSRDIERMDDALEQAISYAEYLGASFVISTNSHKWLVKKKQKNGAWEYVVDINDYNDKTNMGEITTLLETANNLSPLLFWLHKYVPSDEAQVFWIVLETALKKSFRQFICDINENLYEIIIGLVELINKGCFRKDSKCKTTQEQVEIIHQRFQSFLQDYELEYDFEWQWDYHDLNETFETNFEFLGLDLGEFLDKNEGIKNNTIRLLELTTHFALYLGDSARQGSYLEIGESTTQKLFDFIEPYLMQKFNISLPTHPSNPRYRWELKNICAHEWEKTKNSYHD